MSPEGDIIKEFQQGNEVAEEQMNEVSCNKTPKPTAPSTLFAVWRGNLSSHLLKSPVLPHETA